MEKWNGGRMEYWKKWNIGIFELEMEGWMNGKMRQLGGSIDKR